jgi:hypothetical protein
VLSLIVYKSIILSTYMPWKEIPISPPPKCFKDQVPIYQIIKDYFLENGNEKLRVRRSFSIKGGEGLNVEYDGPEYKENMTIHEGQIKCAQTIVKEKLVDAPKSDDEDFIDKFQEFLTQSAAKQQIPTYHNIKRFEDELRQLPWQEDFAAIYTGDGFYR